MSNSDDPSADVGTSQALRLRHFRRDFLDAILEGRGLDGVSSRNYASTYFTVRVANEVIGLWLPMAVSSGCFAQDDVAAIIRAAPIRRIIDEPAPDADTVDILEQLAETVAGWEQTGSASLELATDDAYDLLYVLMETAADQVANRFVALLVAGQLTEATSFLRRRLEGTSQAELVDLAANLPPWMTDGPYRQRANLAFLGDEIDQMGYASAKHHLRHTEIVDQHPYWERKGPPAGAAESDDQDWLAQIDGLIRSDALFQLARAERQFVREVATFSDWAGINEESESQQTTDAEERDFVLELFVRMLDWRLIPAERHVADLLDYIDALQPLVRAVSPHIAREPLGRSLSSAASDASTPEVLEWWIDPP